MICCKEAGILGEKMGEKKLSTMETFKLMYHMVWCKNCRRFKKQIDWINRALKQIDLDEKFTQEEKGDLKEKVNPEMG